MILNDKNGKKLGVSVIIPTYNQTELLSRAIKSILNQSYKKIEIIVIDDNVDFDISKEVKLIVSKFKNIDLNYIKNKENMGSAVSRNIGAKAAKYDIITFLDDDDYYLEKKIERQLQHLLKADALYSICNIKLIYSNGYEDVRERKYLSKNSPILTQHLKHHITGTSTFMYNKNFFLSLGGFPETDLGDEFLLMTNSILKSDRLSHCDEVLVIASINSQSGLSSNENKIKSENNLIKYKTLFFDKMRPKDIKYIKMRHHLVKGFVYLKMKNYLESFKHGFIAIYYNPKGILDVIWGKDR